MKKVFLMFFVSLCFGIIAVAVWTGPAHAAKGGITACQANLSTCNANLGTCNANLGSCTTDLGTCNSSLGICQSDLTQAQSDLNTCNAGLSTCNSELGTCNADLAACQAQPVCGDGIVEGTEDCDVSNLNGATCATQGFAGGTLTCATGCTFDTSGCFATRFVDNSDGTVTDNQTGLIWEKKETAVGSGANLNNPHDVDNTYTWTALVGGTAPNGTAFTDFLHKLNNTCNGSGATPCAADTDCAVGVCGFTGRRDWRLPEVNGNGGVAELETILDLTKGFCGGGSGACIDETIFGPTAATFYWSAVTFAVGPTVAWAVNFSNGFVGPSLSKELLARVRAVRTGP